MYALRQLPAEPEQDQHILLHGLSWQAFEAMLAIRGDGSGVRMYYLDGEVELLSPTKTHEERKTALARLLEQWALEIGVELTGFGSWTLKREIKEAGAEPDECYILGPRTDRDVPDLVIEVEWSKPIGLPKHEIYRRLGVRELWTLRADGGLVVRTLGKGSDPAWTLRAKSRLLPKLDVAWLLAFLDRGSQTTAVRALRDELRGKPRRR